MQKTLLKADKNFLVVFLADELLVYERFVLSLEALACLITTVQRPPFLVQYKALGHRCVHTQPIIEVAKEEEDVSSTQTYVGCAKIDGQGKTWRDCFRRGRKGLK